MKKALKTILIIALVLLLLGGAVAGVVLWRFNARYISPDEALTAAAAHAGVAIPAMRDREVDFERYAGQAWYSVEFETGSDAWEYAVDAVTGAILSSHTEKDY